ncbi:MAG: hypothetical protein LAO79_10080 [Acidobacteriia bacterium]|nr:hypothetical protein [Terriglobia bacterium]
MRSSVYLRFVYLAALAAGLFGQATSTVGVVTKIDAAAQQLVVKTDQGPEVTVTMEPKASFRRTKPGETSLANAATIAITDINAGDRVLARGKPSEDQKSVAATLVVVMSKSDIAQKQAAEKADWDKRGVVGTVTAASPTEIALSVRGPGGAKTLIVTPAENAVIRRYSPESIKFEDAKPSALGEIRTGDQVRARGDKSADGTKMAAQEIVSGTFRELAATIISIDAANNQLRVNDLATKKPVTIRINADSSVKKLPLQMAQMLAARTRPADPGGRAGGPPAGAAAGRGGFEGRGGRGGGGDLTQMLDRVPKVTLADLKNGDAIIVLSTVGSSPDQLTVITMLAGVEPILTKPGTREMQLGDWSLGGGLGGGEP